MGTPIMSKDAVLCLVLYERARAIAPDLQLSGGRGFTKTLVVWECTYKGRTYATAIDPELVSVSGWTLLYALLRDAVDTLERLVAGTPLPTFPSSTA